MLKWRRGGWGMASRDDLWLWAGVRRFLLVYSVLLAFVRSAYLIVRLVDERYASAGRNLASAGACLAVAYWILAPVRVSDDGRALHVDRWTNATRVVVADPNH